MTPDAEGGQPSSLPEDSKEELVGGRVESFDVQDLGPPAPRRSMSQSTVKSRLTRKVARASMVGSMALGGDKQGNLNADAILEDELATETFVQKGGLTFGEAVSNLVIALVGATVTVFPSVMASTGWIMAPVLMAMTALFLVECGFAMCEACEAAELNDGTEAGSVSSFEDLAKHAGMEKFLMVSNQAVMIGTILLFVNFQTDAICSFIPGKDKPVVLMRFLVVMPFFMLLAMVKDLKQLARFSVLGLLAVMMECVGITAGSVLQLAGLESCTPETKMDDSNCAWYSELPPQNKDGHRDMLGSIGISLSVFVFGFAVLATIPSVRSQLAEPVQMPKVLTTAISIALVLYLFLMILAYFAFGQKSHENVISGITEYYPITGSIPSIGLIINITFSTPIFTYCVMSVVEALGTGPMFTPLTIPNIGIRCGMILVITIVCHLLPFIVAIIGLVSSIFGVANNITFPLLFFYILRGRCGDRVLPISMLRKSYHLTVFLVGLFVTFFGFKGALETLITQLNGKNPETEGLDGV